ncbi:MAG: hypothetical protein P4L53_22345 [Candidatus Obscuribacterales bacterium]|nr:hypothetical protein [Candidatus Obscuribacterales bacterium]
MSSGYLIKISRNKFFFFAAILLSFGSVSLISTAPAFAKHKELPVANIFTPAANQIATTPVFVSGNGKPIVNKPSEEPSWDNVKALPDIKPEQTKTINKMRDQYNKSMASIRNEINDANQKLKNLKEHKPIMASTERLPAPLGLMTPDGKPYMGPLLGDASLGNMENGEESVDEVQAHIDSLKQEISELNKSNDSQLKATLTADQLGELDLMRQGKLIIKEPKNVLADAHSLPAPGPSNSSSPPTTGSQSGSAAGAKILGRVLRSSAKSLIYRAAMGGF